MSGGEGLKIGGMELFLPPEFCLSRKEFSATPDPWYFVFYWGYILKLNYSLKTNSFIHENKYTMYTLYTFGYIIYDGPWQNQWILGNPFSRRRYFRGNVVSENKTFDK